MSTGQNRRSINELTNDEMQAALKTWHPPVLPPPETGAVDVEKLADAIMRYNPLFIENVIEVLQPLTQRISELEQENERLKNRYIEDVRLATLRAEAAEARVKELEQKLEAALKLTTDKSIEFMRGKV